MFLHGSRIHWQLTVLLTLCLVKFNFLVVLKLFFFDLASFHFSPRRDALLWLSSTCQYTFHKHPPSSVAKRVRVKWHTVIRVFKTPGPWSVNRQYWLLAVPRTLANFLSGEWNNVFWIQKKHSLCERFSVYPLGSWCHKTFYQKGSFPNTSVSHPTPRPPSAPYSTPTRATSPLRPSGHSLPRRRS